MRKKVVILGSAGSIGESAMKVAEALPDRIEVVGLAVRRNVSRVLEQAARLGVRHVAVEDSDAAKACAALAPAGVRVLHGAAGVSELAALGGTDIVLCAVVGMAGLRPVMAAVARGTTVALATKEVLVGAGAIVTAGCVANGSKLLPVDSEHSAIFQCLDGRNPRDISRILLTASGGPFAGKPQLNFDKVSIKEALAHPRWNMGRKVSIDSATMMNKGLEIMEAHWLFDTPIDRIDVVIHPESIVHSMVEFRDRSVLAQMSPPDMRFAIQYALTYPDRVDGGLPALDLPAAGALHFSRPDPERFPCLSLARAAAQAGGSMPAVLNAANEVAVTRFLAGELKFSGIWHVVEKVMARHSRVPGTELDEIIEADRWAREAAAVECP